MTGNDTRTCEAAYLAVIQANPGLEGRALPLKAFHTGLENEKVNQLA
jgi:hypothetical protein